MILLIHLIGAGLTALLVISALFSLIFKRTTWLKPQAVAIAVMAAVQLISGSWLSYSINSTLTTYCARIGLYLGVLVVAELFLVRAVHRAHQKFPTRAVASSFATGLAAVVAYVGLALF